MQLSGTRSAGIEAKDRRAAKWLTGQLGVLAGLAILAVIAFVFASLATWNVDDPSLSNANGRLPQNAGGFIGSSVADLLIQFTGLASVIVLVPPPYGHGSASSSTRSDAGAPAWHSGFPP